MYTLYEEIELGWQSWDENFHPKFYSPEPAQIQHEDYSLQSHVASSVNLAKHVALAGYRLYVEDCFEVLDPEKQEDVYAGLRILVSRPSHCRAGRGTLMSS
jgi:hypothetical protein